jgi:prepilin-type N-terminal cleavage/methylation domain-containing protein
MRSLKHTNGFTLVELIIGMAIIAIITGALWGNFFTSLTKGRDSKRKQDLDMMVKGLELYYHDNKRYPPTDVMIWGNPLVNPNNASVIYMQKLPNDPSSPSYAYCYDTNETGTYFKIYAILDNKSDSKILSSPVTCGGVSYNYGIASTNTVP